MAPLFNNSGRGPILQYTENSGDTSQCSRVPARAQQKYRPVFPSIPVSWSLSSEAYSRRTWQLVQAVAEPHLDRSNDPPLHFPNSTTANTAIASGLQSHRLGSIDDLPARIQSPIPVQGAHRCARCGLGGVRSAALAGGSHRTLSRTAIAAGRLPASIALLRRSPGRPRRRCPLGCEANKGTVGRFAPTAVNQRLKFLRQYGQVIAL